MKRIILSGILLIIGGLTACGSETAVEPVELTIELSEFSYSPDTIELVVGQEVTLNFINTGALHHEFMIGHEANIHEDGTIDGYGEDFFAVGGVEPVLVSGMAMLDGEMRGDKMGMYMNEEHMNMEGEGMRMGMGSMSDRPPGYMVMLTPEMNTATITFTVTAEMIGTWQFGCFVEEGTHFNAGMVGSLIVSEQ